MADLEKTSLDVQHHLLDHTSRNSPTILGKQVALQQLQGLSGRLGRATNQVVSAVTITQGQWTATFVMMMDSKVCNANGKQFVNWSGNDLNMAASHLHMPQIQF